MTRRDPRPSLVVVAASARALAMSASRAGWSVHAADLFADADLRAIAATAVRVPIGRDSPWPAGLEQAVRDFPIAPWCYGGALENHPDLVDRLARDRPLAGNGAGRLAAVRDPVCLQRVLHAAGIAYPETVLDASTLPVDGSFVVKPRASAGGRGVARWRGGSATMGRIWQRFVPGRPRAAIFTIDGRGARLTGVSHQLVGRRWCGGRGFAYCGSVDQAIDSLATPIRASLDRLGHVLATDFGLVGLVGVDFVVDAHGRFHVIEINPRPTASAELVERATGVSAAATHLAACGFAPPRSATLRCRAARAGVWAKAIVFAAGPLVMSARMGAAVSAAAARWTANDGGDWPAVADVPVVGGSLAAGGPVLTVFAVAGGRIAALRTLRRRVATIRSLLRAGPVSPPYGVEAQPPLPPPGRTA